MLTGNKAKTGDFESTKNVPQSGLLNVCDQDKICVSKEYLLRDLMSNEFAFLGNNKDDSASEYLSVSKGIFLYVLYKKGEGLFRTSSSTTPLTKTDLQKIRITFLPPSLRDMWLNVINNRFLHQSTITASETLTLWEDFLLYAIKSDTKSFLRDFAPSCICSVGTCHDITKELLIYALYGQALERLSVFGEKPSLAKSTALEINLDFLPSSIVRKWKAKVMDEIPAEAITTSEGLSKTLLEFLQNIIMSNDEDLIERYAALWPYMEHRFNEEKAPEEKDFIPKKILTSSIKNGVLTAMSMTTCEHQRFMRKRKRNMMRSIFGQSF